MWRCFERGAERILDGGGMKREERRVGVGCGMGKGLGRGKGRIMNKK